MRAAMLVMAVLALLLLVLDAVRAPGGSLVLWPVAPPLTRIRSLGDAPLAEPGGGPPPGPPPGGPPPDLSAGHALRVQVEADAIAIAAVLGEERVEAAIARREALSAMLGETAVYDELVGLLAKGLDGGAVPAPR